MCLRKLEDHHLPKEERWPEDPDVRKADQHECAWLSAEQLFSAYYLSYASASGLGTREFFVKMKSISLTDQKNFRGIKRLTQSHIKSDKWKHLEGISLSNIPVEEAMVFFEEVSLAVIEKYSNSSMPTYDDDTNASSSDESKDPGKKLREAPTVQASTNAIIAASGVDPFAVLMGALKEARKLLQRAIQEEDEPLYINVVNHASVLLKKNEQDGGYKETEAILLNWIGAAEHRESID